MTKFNIEKYTKSKTKKAESVGRPMVKPPTKTAVMPPEGLPPTKKSARKGVTVLSERDKKKVKNNPT